MKVMPGSLDSTHFINMKELLMVCVCRGVQAGVHLRPYTTGGRVCVCVRN